VTAWTLAALLVLAAVPSASAPDAALQAGARKRVVRLAYPELLSAHLRHGQAASRSDAVQRAAEKRATGAPAYAGPQRLDPQVTGDGAIGDRLGAALASAGGLLLVGAPFDSVVRAGEYGGVSAGTVTVLTFDANGFQRQVQFSPGDAGNSGQFGSAIAFDGTVAVVGAPFESPNDEFARGAAWVFRRNGAQWTEEARLEAPSPVAGDRFGTAAAISGDRVVIGAPRRDVASEADAGSAFVFERVGGVWTLVATLASVTPIANDRLGNAVALDGDLALAGAPGMDPNAAPVDSGAVVPFVRDAGGNWNAGAAIAAPGVSQGAQSGFTLALSSDTLAAAAPTDAVGGATGRGSVALFPRIGPQAFGPAQVVAAQDGVAGDEFGFSLALDGARLLVGAPDHDSGEGAGYVFLRTAGVWAQEAKASSPNGPFADVGGYAVAWLDGNAVLGAPQADRPPNRAQGEVRRYTMGAGLVLADTFDSGDGAADELSGFSVAVDRGTAVVGSYRDDTVSGSDDAGTASVFRYGTGGWERVVRLEAADGESEDLFGIAVAVDGDTIAVGAYQDIVGVNINQGSVYIFENGPGGWTQAAQLLAPDGAGNDFLGFSLAFDGARLVAGAPGDDDEAVNAGAAYVWRREGADWVLEHKLTIAGATTESFAGIAVAIRDDLAVMGAPQADIGDQPLAGRVGTFVRDATGWRPLAAFTAPGVAAFDFFGGAVATDGSRIAVGSPGDSTGEGMAEIIGHGSTWVFTRDSTGVSPEQQVAAAVPEPGAGAGTSVSIAGDRLVVGASGADGAFEDSGAAAVYQRGVNGWSLVQALAPADAVEFEYFGRSAAMDATHLMIGAPERSRANPREGAAYAWRDTDRLLGDGFE
jgi:hypothetical protein